LYPFVSLLHARPPLSPLLPYTTLFRSISGIDDDGTLLDFDYHEVHVLQAAIANARQVWLAADHSKFGRQALVRLGPLSMVDALFTDREPPPRLAAAIAEAGAQLHIAEPVHL